jgi:type II secretory pathway pseudopilin PulG
MLNFLKNKKIISNKTKTGFTLVEMLVYIALMTTITLVLVQSLVTVLKSNRSSFADINLRNAGYSAMEAMIREIHSSATIDSPSASGNILQMEQGSSSANTVVEFATTSNNVLNFYQGPNLSAISLIGPLTAKSITIKNLTFTKINTGNSLAIKIQMQLSTTVNGITKSETFYDTAILRGSY